MGILIVFAGPVSFGPWDYPRWNAVRAGLGRDPVTS